MKYPPSPLGRTECFQVAAIILRCREERNLGQAVKVRQVNCWMFHRKSTPAQPYPYILCALFLTLLTSRFTIRVSTASGARRTRVRALRPLGEARCNICRGGRCSASIKNVPRGGTGCGRISPAPMRAWSFVLAVATPCRRYRRQSDRAFAWGRVRWQRVLCGPGHDRFFCWRRAIIRRGRRQFVSGLFIFAAASRDDMKADIKCLPLAASDTIFSRFFGRRLAIFLRPMIRVSSGVVRSSVAVSFLGNEIVSKMRSSGGEICARPISQQRFRSLRFCAVFAGQCRASRAKHLALQGRINR